MDNLILLLIIIGLILTYIKKKLFNEFASLSDDLKSKFKQVYWKTLIRLVVVVSLFIIPFFIITSMSYFTHLQIGFIFSITLFLIFLVESISTLNKIRKLEPNKKIKVLFMLYRLISFIAFLILGYYNCFIVLKL